MASITQAAADNLLSPMVLFFALGLLAGWAKSDLTIPEAIAKALSIYLMMSIGMKGGIALAENGIDQRFLLLCLAGIGLSFLLPFLAYALFRRLGGIE
ncbi:MAG: sodium-dependent bicarbonate transport family permease, partial [Rhodospirillaceae bacterium]|nr:sodium-dependent bicarbonate transport family permease [Rhodospirillaceae bacterium]